MLPLPLVVYGCGDKGSEVERVLSARGCIHAHLDVASVDSSRDLFGALLCGLVQAVVARVVGQGHHGQCGSWRQQPQPLPPGEARGGLAAFAGRLLSRGRSGVLVLSALTAWGGQHREALAEAAAGAAEAAGEEAGGGGCGLLSVPSRADTPGDFSSVLGALGGLRVWDVAGGAEGAGAEEAEEAWRAWPLGLWLTLDGADRLAMAQPSLIPWLLALRSTSLCSGLSLVLLSHSAIPIAESLRGAHSRNAAAACLYMAWPPQSREAARELLARQPPPPRAGEEGAPSLPKEALYRAFLDRLFTSLQGVLSPSDTHEWRYAADTLWPEFCKPLLSPLPTMPPRPSPQAGTNTTTTFTCSSTSAPAGGAAFDATALHRAALPAFDAFRCTLLSRGGSSGAPLLALSHSASAGASSGSGGGGGSAQRADCPTSLPFYTRLLLVASYAASHNPPHTDVRYFSRAASGRRGGRGGAGGGAAMAASAVPAGHTLPLADGPHTFSVDRVLAIAHTLCAALLGPNASQSLALTTLYGDALRDLEAMHYLKRCGGPGGRGGAEAPSAAAGAAGAGGGQGSGSHDRPSRLSQMGEAVVFLSFVAPATAFQVARTLTPPKGTATLQQQSLDLAHYLHDFTLG